MTRLIIYRDDANREPFSEWISRLRDHVAQTRIQFRLRMAQAGHLGDTRSVGGGVFEMRIHVGQGYRVYYGRQGDALIILLCGGSKSTQKDDIQAAQGYWADWRRRIR